MPTTIPGISPSAFSAKLTRLITCPIELYTPVLVTSVPGNGKTSIVSQTCQQKGVKLWTFRPIFHESVELVGLPCPVEGNGHATWRPFADLLPTDPNWEGVIFIDEVTQLPADMQKPIAALLDKEGIAGRRIPKGARFVLAGNRQQDRAGAQRMLSIIESRCQQCELLFSLEDWKKWAFDADIDQTVISFADFKGGSFVTFDSSVSLNPLPRTWHRVSNEIKTVGASSTSKEDTDVLSSVAGLVGPGPAAEYMAFREHFHLLHNVVDKVFKSPTSVQTNDDLSVMHALVGAVTQRVAENAKTLKDSELDNVVEFGSKKLPKSLTALLMLNLMLRATQRVSTLKSYHAWCVENREILATWKK